MLNADDFHLPSFLISSSDLPKAEKEVAALILNECLLKSFGFNFRIKRFSKLIQPGNVLNIYGLNDKIKLLVPLILHSNNLSYFLTGQITLLLQELITNLVVLANWSVFEEGVFKITVSPPKSNEIS